MISTSKMAEPAPNKPRGCGEERLSRFGGGLCLLAVICFQVFAAVEGLEFGKHIDEAMARSVVIRAVHNGFVLPQRYNYPSMTFDLTLLALVPETIRHAHLSRDDAASLKKVKQFLLRLRDTLEQYARGEHFIMTSRFIFVVISACGTLWAYLLALAWRRRAPEALAAASIVAASWEIGYHMRWIAPDLVMTQFACLTMVLFMRWFWSQKHSGGLLLGAAFAAGLTCGTKYPGGLLVLTLLLGVWMKSRDAISWPDAARSMGTICVVFTCAYLITTPGTVIDPLRFVRDICMEMRHYQSGHNGAHEVQRGLEHLGRIMWYIAMEVPSPFKVIALSFSVLGCVGCVVMIRESPRAALVFLSFPLLYLFFFSLQKVLFVRNILVITPFWALLIARGFVFGTHRLANRWRFAAMGAYVVFACCMFANVAWLYSAAESIRQRSPEADLRELAHFANSQRSGTILVSETVRKQSDDLNVPLPIPRTHAPHEPAPLVALRRFEIEKWQNWKGNGDDRFLMVFGPRDANLKYYPDNAGHDHIVILPAEAGTRLGAAIHQDATTLVP